MLAFGKVAAQAVTDPGHQAGNRLEIIKTDLFHYATFGKDSIRIRKLLGNVHLRQDSTDLLCDSAYQFIDSNFVVAYSRVKIVLSRTRTITADKVTYDGDSKIVNFWDGVTLRDSSITLETPRLTYYRTPDYAEYLQGGVVRDKENTLTSKHGFYYPARKMAYFKNAVKLVNPDFTLVTDTLGYNTDLKVAYFMAPTTVQDENSTIYTEDGFYDTKNDFAFLNQRSSLADKDYVLTADTIQYDKARDLGKAMGHVMVEQKDSSMTVYGKYGEFKSKTESSFVTDSAFAIQYINGDTVYLFADTLTSFKDTVADKRYFFAYNDASFFMRDMQGVCDSLVYWYDDSLMFFYGQPALWSDQSQITGDTMNIVLRSGFIDSMSIPRNPFIATKEDTVGFDQIKGKALFAKFDNESLKKMWIFGNSESIYFTKDDQEQYMGMNTAKCTDMVIDFKENKPSKILFKDKPKGEYFPMHMVLYKENKLEGFVWREEERPQRPDWVFDVINHDAYLLDTLRRSMDSLFSVIEELEFSVYDLLQDSIFQDAGPDFDLDSLHLEPKDSISPKDSIALANNSKNNLKGNETAPTEGKANVQANTAAKPMTRQEEGLKEIVDLLVTQEQQKQLKSLTVKKIVENARKRPSAAQVSAKERELQEARIAKARAKIAAKAQRMAGKANKKLSRRAYRRRLQMKPKDAEFNDLRINQ